MTVCIIPARLNSTRFPNKLMKNVFGKTVLQHTFDSLLGCNALKEIYVATDNEIIAEHIENLGGKVLWTSSNPKDGTERILEALKNYPKLEEYEFIVNVQADHPCISHNSIASIVESLSHDSSCFVSTGIFAIKTLEDFLSPQIVKCVFDKHFKALYFSRSPIPFSQNGSFFGYGHLGIYCYRSSFFKQLCFLENTFFQGQENLEQLKFLEHGYPIKVALIKEQTPSIDVPEDLIKLEQYLCQKNTFL